jgi:RNA polymerase sigma-70 factor (ECF subfamily)
MDITLNDAEDLVSVHRPYLLRFARQRLRDGALVEDVVQDTLLAALQGLERFTQKSSLRTWLTGILLNKIADSVRRDHRAASLAGGIDAAPAGEPDDDDPQAGGDEPVEWRDPERLLESRQFIEQLRDRLEALPPLAARAFTLREIDGLSLDEISRELGVTTSHSAVLLHRARHRLRDGLQQGGFIPAAG